MSTVWTACGLLLACGLTVAAVGAAAVAGLRGVVTWLDRP